MIFPQQTLKTLLGIALALLILIITACQAAPVELSSSELTDSLPRTETPMVLETIPLSVGYGVRDDWFELYFTDPTNPNAYLSQGGPDVTLVEAISQARASVDVAAYSLSLASIRTALIDAHQRGVVVRLVMDSDNMDSSAVQDIIAAGIPVLGDRREGLMHAKFVVIDHSEIWLGSMNFTYSGMYEDHNNIFRLRSPEVAENYTTEFEEMFIEDRFGPDVLARTPNRVVSIGDTQIETYFSPDDHVASRIIQLLNSAQQNIYFMAFAFTVEDFSEILIYKAAAGLTVRGLLETDQYNSDPDHSEYNLLHDTGVDVHLDDRPAQLHHKVFIIDGQIVIFGSYNFTASAERNNDENVMIIFNPLIAAQYLAEFQRLYALVQP